MKYKSCINLEQGITFFSNSVHVCCISSNEGGGQIPFIKNYKGEKIDWTNIEKYRAIFREYAKKGKLPLACKNCPFLEEKEWEEIEHFTQILIGHWTYCNCNCIYCYTEKNKKFSNSQKPYKLHPIIKEMIEKGLIKEDSTISFGGGEPTILKEFTQLMNLFFKLKSKNIRIHSDGIKYSKEIEKGLKIGSVTLITSIDAGTKEIYEKIKQVKCFDKVWNNLKKYAKIKNELIKVKYVLIPGINDSISEIDNWLLKTKEAKIKNIAFDIEDNWYKKNRNDIPKYIYTIFDYVMNEYSKYGIKSCELYERARDMKDSRQTT